MAIAVPRPKPLKHALRWRGSPARREATAFYIFISPWIFGFLVFTLGPIIASAYLSFTQYDIANAPKWVGLTNYQNLFTDPIFLKSVVVTLHFAVLALPLGLEAQSPWPCS